MNKNVTTLDTIFLLLGFLSTVDDIIPGNLGIKDQQLAMKWVSKRIKHFGGDPSRITLMGQSAGAMSVGYHLMNPQNRGNILFTSILYMLRMFIVYYLMSQSYFVVRSI